MNIPIPPVKLLPKKNNYLLENLFFGLVMISVCLFCVWLFLQPYILSAFNLDKDSSQRIATAISGLTAPVIGLVSIILLYRTLNKQTESLNDQKEKNEIDNLHRLLNQLIESIDKFHFSFKNKEGQHALHGVEAMVKFANFGKTIPQNDDHKFDAFFQAARFISIVNTYSLLNDRLDVAAIPPIYKQHLRSDLNWLYKLTLKPTLESLIEGFSNPMNKQVESFNAIKEFVDKENSKRLANLEKK